MRDRDITPIDPLFRIPSGAESEFVYSRDRSEDFAEGEGSAINELDDVDTGGLKIPDSFKIISQTPRRTKSGTVVIDVVFETDEIDGATKYEMKITKI